MAELVAPKLSIPLTFSESAIAALRNILATEEIKPGQGLRVGVKGGGCSGMSYVLGIDDPSSFDEVYDLGGFQVMMDKRHLLYLINMHVDFQDGLNARGFVFQNPNAKTSCGCGTSFGV